MKLRYAALVLCAALPFVSGANAFDVYDVNISGIVGGGYARTTGDIDLLAGGGAALFSFGKPGFQAQLSADNKHYSASGVTGDLTSITGDFFWRDGKGAIGASVSYHRASAGTSFYGTYYGGSVSAESYGAFGEWYVKRYLSLRVKGGGYSGDFSGAYGGAGFGIYPWSNLSVNASYNYLSLNGGGNEHQIGANVEYLPMRSLPLSISVGYTYDKYNGGGSANTYGIVLKYRFGNPRDDSLTGWDRSGPTQWNGALPLWNNALPL